VDQIEAFFCHYNEMNEKQFKPISRGGPKKAQKLIDRGAEAFQEKQGTDSQKAD